MLFTSSSFAGKDTMHYVMCWLAEKDRTPFHVLCVFTGSIVFVFFARTRRGRFSASKHETSCMVYISENKVESRYNACPSDSAGNKS